jgi:hypothetical protein
LAGFSMMSPTTPSRMAMADTGHPSPPQSYDSNTTN